MMDDIELLAVARQHEKILLRLHSGVIGKDINAAVELAKNDDTIMNCLSAQILLAVGQYIFSWSDDELLVRLRELK